MKRFLCLLFIVTLAVVAPMSNAFGEAAKTTIEDVKKETKEFLNTLGGYSADQKDEAVLKTKETLDKLDTRIESLQTKLDQNWDKLSESAREKTKNNLETLREQRSKLTEMYEGMKTSSGDAWNHMKEGFADAYKSLEESWAKSAQEFSAAE